MTREPAEEAWKATVRRYSNTRIPQPTPSRKLTTLAAELRERVPARVRDLDGPLRAPRRPGVAVSGGVSDCGQRTVAKLVAGERVPGDPIWGSELNVGQCSNYDIRRDGREQKRSRIRKPVNRPTPRSIGRLAFLTVTLALACGDATVQPPTPSNAPPVASGTIPLQSVAVGQSASLDVSAYFRDPDGDPLVYAVQTPDTTIVLVQVSDGTVTITAVAKGSAGVTVTATDPGGLSATRSFIVVVPNQAPVTIDSIPDIELVRGDSAVIDLSNFFHDPDGDSLTFTASTSNPDVATATVSGRFVTVSTISHGTAAITVVATDSGMLARQAIGVSVTVPIPKDDRAALVALYESTDGPNWKNSDNWLTDLALGEWYGVTVDEQSRVTTLGLHGNNLTGRIAPEVGYLPNLRVLTLSANDLTGTIPAELGRLNNLIALHLRQNELIGSIPNALGDLTNLTGLNLNNNRLMGPIPPELGNLSELTWLWLYSNRLTGSIPSEFGKLTDLRQLDLRFNEISGPLPSELADLKALRSLDLSSNMLEGQVPSGYGGMAALRSLNLSYNTRLSGPLPLSLMGLDSLEALLASDTQLCSPIEPGFQQWLQNVPRTRVAPCERSFAYLVQAVQSREFPVPIVAGRKALLRIFLTAAQTNQERMPRLRATFYLEGQSVHIEDLPGKPGPIPVKVDQGDLKTSVNAEIPAEIVQPGLEMVIEVDPDGALDPSLQVTERIPKSGRLELDVRALPTFNLTIVPFLWTENPDSSILAVTKALADDPEGHELFFGVRTLLPVGDLEVKDHEPVFSMSRDPSRLLRETKLIRALEGGTGHYMGTMGPLNTFAGIAYRPGRASFAVLGWSVIAHELGHNMSLHHAPCGQANLPDRNFPRPNGSIGAWGYDFRTGGSLVSPDVFDIMSYCRPHWISDYQFDRALRYRLKDEGDQTTDPTESIIIWGGVENDSLFLEPTFVTQASVELPSSSGDYQITGVKADGTRLFSLSFAMPEISEVGGSFVFSLPVQRGWAGKLATITLSGPEGESMVSDQPMAIARDPRTGQVRGILRDWSGVILSPDLEILTSQQWSNIGR